MTVRKYGKTFWCDFMVDGKRYRKSLQVSDKSLAQRIETKLRDEIISGKWFKKDPAQDKTFKDLIDKFQEGHYVTPSSLATIESVLKALSDFFRETPLNKFNPSLLEDFRNHLIEEDYKPNTIIFHLKTLKRLFNLATSTWQWFDKNPIQSFKVGCSSHRERRLSIEEEQLLLAVAPFGLSHFIRFILNTGLRRTEALNLTWKDVDLANKTITINITKNKSPLVIPMTEWVHDFLREKSKVRSLTNDHIFPFTAGQVEVEFRKTCKIAGILDLHVHDRRHTFASRLVQHGVDISIVQKLLNHKTLSQTQKYVHNNIGTLRMAVMKLSAT